jgi:hypothetical protein
MSDAASNDKGERSGCDGKYPIDPSSFLGRAATPPLPGAADADSRAAVLGRPSQQACADSDCQPSGRSRLAALAKGRREAPSSGLDAARRAPAGSPQPRPATHAPGPNVPAGAGPRRRSPWTPPPPALRLRRCAWSHNSARSTRSAVSESLRVIRPPEPPTLSQSERKLLVGEASHRRPPAPAAGGAPPAPPSESDRKPRRQTGEARVGVTSTPTDRSGAARWPRRPRMLGAALQPRRGWGSNGGLRPAWYGCFLLR